MHCCIWEISSEHLSIPEFTAARKQQHQKDKSQVENRQEGKRSSRPDLIIQGPSNERKHDSSGKFEEVIHAYHDWSRSLREVPFQNALISNIDEEWDYHKDRTYHPNFYRAWVCEELELESDDASQSTDYW